MTDDRGQALVLVVLALGIAAVTVVGLLTAQDRILADAHERRAGEAAVEAAGAAVADAQVDLLTSLRDQLGRAAAPTRADLDAFVADPRVLDRSRAAANDLAAANGAGPVRDVAITVVGRSLEIALAVGSHTQRVSIRTTCCRR